MHYSYLYNARYSRYLFIEILMKTSVEVKNCCIQNFIYFQTVKSGKPNKLSLIDNPKFIHEHEDLQKNHL